MLGYEKSDSSGDSAHFEPRGRIVESIAADKTLNIGDSGKVFLVGTDALTITLLDASAYNVGAEFTFINTGADGGVALTLSPAATDAIVGSIANAAADSVSGGVAGKDIVNTKATANKGDRITLTITAANQYIITEGVGIWASES